jgi:FkbM family methyltransferase
MIKKLLNLIKAIIRGKFIYFSNVNIPKEWIGNKYGGFFLHSDILNSNSIIYSVGIGEDISFDMRIINKLKCRVFGFDPTPKSVEFIKNLNPPSEFIFNQYGVSNTTGVIKFFLPKNDSHVSGSLLNTSIVNEEDSIPLKFKSLNDIMKSFNHQHIDVLKIDIEGYEYQLIDYIYDNKVQINQFLVEFHPDLISGGKEKTRRAIKKLDLLGLNCYAVSDSFSELSFINTKLIEK